MNQATKNSYVFGEFRLEEAERQLLHRGTAVPLPPKILDTLLLLVESAGHLIEKDEFMNRLWPETFVGEDALARNISILRKTLGESGDSQSFIATVPTRGYRFVASVQQVNGSEPPTSEKCIPTRADFSEEFRSTPKALKLEVPLDAAPVSAKPNVRHSGRPWKSAAASLLIALSIFVFLAVAGYLTWRHFGPSRQARAGKVMLAVLPFQNLTGDPAQDYFSDGLTEEMITALGSLQSQQLSVIARTSVMQYKHSEKPIVQIGHELGVQYLLEGSVRREADRVRISAQLIRADDQTHLWAKTYQRDLRDIFDVQNEVAEAVSGQIQVALTASEKARLGSARAVNLQAHEAYLMGRFHWNKRTHESLLTGLSYFQKAVSLDPNDPLGYSGIANCYLVLGGNEWLPPDEAFRKSKEAALKALALNDELAEAHSVLGQIYQEEYDWAASEKEIVRTVALNPSFAIGYQRYSYFLAKTGQYDKAITEAKHAVELDPILPVMGAALGQALYISRRYDESQQEFEKVLEVDPGAWTTSVGLALTYAQKEMFADSVDLLEKANRNFPGDITVRAELGYAYAKWGKKHEAEILLNELKAESHRKYVSGLYVAMVCIGLGRNEEAMQWLDRAYKQRDYVLTWLGADPVFDPLHSDPRFQDLLHRMNLTIASDVIPTHTN